MAHLKQTPSQTVGPYFAYGITPKQYNYQHGEVADNQLFKNRTDGERINIVGRIFDGEGNPIDDALIELRQDATIEGFGRMGTGTEADLSFQFSTLKPTSNGKDAPHINVTVLMRGLLNHVFTRIYFSDEVNANKHDPVLKNIPEERRNTLIAKREEVNGMVKYHFDIHMQGANETVFFDA